MKRGPWLALLALSAGACEDRDPAAVGGIHDAQPVDGDLAPDAAEVALDPALDAGVEAVTRDVASADREVGLSCTGAVAIHVHLCGGGWVLKEDGSTWGWGANATGQLGDGTTASRAEPGELVVAGSNIAQISAGARHTCARLADGTAWCWGDAANFGGHDVSLLWPRQIEALGSEVAEVAAGAHHTCARKVDGTLWCLGVDIRGETGAGTPGMRARVPIQVLPLGTAVAEVVAGSLFTCARKVDGTVWCWGLGVDGELGDGTFTDRSTPVQVSNLAEVVQLSSGNSHTCARKRDGTVWCWGRNRTNNVGNGTTMNQPAPVLVTGLDNAAFISAGGEHSCAVRVDGTAWCWGLASEGRLGDGSNILQARGPVQVEALGTSVAQVAAGTRHTCALTRDGGVWCWGSGTWAIGDGRSLTRLMPVQVRGCP